MNTTNKIMSALIGVAIFIVPSVSFASASFSNDTAQGFATLLVTNNTTSPAGSTDLWRSTASASAGDEVSFEIYYHNIGPDTANNVRVTLSPQTTGTATTQTFTAAVSADNAPSISSSATVSLSSSQSISFIPGMVTWYPYNSSTASANLLSGQTGAELFNGGLNLGNIIPGWSRQGTVIVTFKVSSSQQSGSAAFATTNSATNITQTSATLNGSLNPNGSDTTAWFEWGTTPSFGTTIQKGPQGNGAGATNITAGVWNLNANTTYYFRAVANNAYGTTYGTTLSFTTGNFPSSSTLPTVITNTATSISQNSATINGYANPNGTSDTVRWFEWGTGASSLNNQTTHYSHGTTPDGFSTNLSGLAQNTTYYFRAVAQNSQGVAQGSTLSFVTNNNGGGNQSQAVVNTQSATSISSDSAVLNGYVDPNGTSDTTRWFEWGANSSSNMYYQTPRYNQGSFSGNFSASISGFSQSTTYYFRAVAQNAQGTVYGNAVSFTVGNNCYNGSSYWNCNNNNNNVSTVNTRNADTAGTYAVLNGYADPSGNGDMVHWFEWGSSYAFGQTTQYVSQGNYASNFSATITGLYPNSVYYYRAAARNGAGTTYGATLTFTTTSQTNTNNNSMVSGSTPTVTTLLATNTTGSSAVLNGLVFNTGNQASSAWFEWGTNVNTTSKTQAFTVGALPVVRYADTINGLVSGQTYYYRIAAENIYGRVYGSTLSFVAQNATASDNSVVVSAPAPITRTVTVVTRGTTEATSLVALAIDGGDDTIASGEKRVYHVTWTNQSAQTLKNVVLRVTFPQALNIDSASRGSYSAPDNAVTVDLKTLASSEKGEAFIFATAGGDLKAGQLLVVTANMVYTKTNGSQGDAIAYVTQRVIDAGTSNGLGASIFGAGSFLPTTLFGWMLLVILVLILVLVGHHVYGRFAEK